MARETLGVNVVIITDGSQQCQLSTRNRHDGSINYGARLSQQLKAVRMAQLGNPDWDITDPLIIIKGDSCDPIIAGRVVEHNSFHGRVLGMREDVDSIGQVKAALTVLGAAALERPTILLQRGAVPYVPVHRDPAQWVENLMVGLRKAHRDGRPLVSSSRVHYRTNGFAGQTALRTPGLAQVYGTLVNSRLTDATVYSPLIAFNPDQESLDAIKSLPGDDDIDFKRMLRDAASGHPDWCESFHPSRALRAKYPDLANLDDWCRHAPNTPEAAIIGAIAHYDRRNHQLATEVTASVPVTPRTKRSREN